MEEWLSARPPKVRELLARYPLGSEIVSTSGDRVFVLGANEGGHLVVAPIAARGDYARAYAERFYICADCIAAGRVHRLQ